MARKLKTFQTSLGFYDLAIVAPSMKAALEAWGAGSNLFYQGVAKETDDPDVVAATMSKPGVVLKRPAGSDGRVAEQSDLPSDLGSAGKRSRREGRRAKPAKRPPAEISERDVRKAAAEFEKQQKRREAERRREELPGKGTASGARRLQPKPRWRWTRPSASMRSGRRASRQRSRGSRGARGPRMTCGKRKGSGCRLRSGGRGSRPARVH
jgi:hypothetical protein